MTAVPRRGRRAGDVVRTLVAVVLVLHGLVHLLGVWPSAGGQGVELAGTTPATRVLWLVAALTVVAAGLGLGRGRRHWWYLGASALVASQVAIATAWPEAAAGTAANVLLALAVLHGWLAEGPRGRRERYRRHQSAVQAEAAGTAHVDDMAPPVSETDLAHLPPQVATYLRRAGVVGRPHVRAFRATLSGRIRSGPDAPWMPFVGEQVNEVDAAGQMTRWFRMDATMFGLPVDVLHVYRDGDASMSAAVCSTVRVAAAAGPEMGRCETVTVLNDLCVLAPGALVRAPIVWSPVDANRVRARFSCGAHTVEAVLVFDDAGDLVDFVSSDRARIDGPRIDVLDWSTPVGGHAEMSAGRVPTVGSAWWHESDGAYPYIEMRIHDVEVLAPGLSVLERL
jgi:hypothetical protein